ncbi:MAG: HdeD family acid-resistance protein [Solirubrobacterales bacterium]
MSEHAAGPRFGIPPIPSQYAEAVRRVTGYWWLWLVVGIAWIVISVVILQFDQASVTTVGILVGLMFTLAGILNIALAAVPREVLEATQISSAWRWVAGLFGVLFLVAAVVCFISPENTFAALADSLGFLFLLIGTWWMVEAFMERAINQLWWLTLIAGILMFVLAFWTGGQFFIDKVYLLLVFAGIWALMEGIVDVVRAFQIREVNKQL